MPTVTLIFGALLVALGLWGRFGTGTNSPTALIPAAIGVGFLFLGWRAQNPAKLKGAMHGAAMLGLIGFLGSAPRGIPGAIAYLQGQPVARPAAVLSQAIMAGLMLVFLILCIQSFIAARRARRAAA